MPGENAGKFIFFWSVIIPALMAAGSILVTYLLYRHFASQVGQAGKSSPAKGR